MEDLALQLKPYKDVVSLLVTIFSVTQYIMGLIICYAVRKNKACGYSSLLFAASLVAASLGLKYAAIINDYTSMSVHAASVMVHVIYITFHSFYCHDRWGEVFAPLIHATAIIGILIAYAEFEKEDKIEYRFGVIVTITALCVKALPLRHLKLIYENRDSSYLPCLSATISFVVATIWVTYSIIIKNKFILLQNIFATVISFTQVALCYIYPRRNIRPPRRNIRPPAESLPDAGTGENAE